MKNLIFLRKKKKLTQNELAETIGVTVRMIQRYEKGESDIPMKNLEKLSTFFEVPIAYFYENEDSKFNKPLGTKNVKKSEDSIFPITFTNYYEIAEFFVKNQPEFLKYDIVDKMIRVYEERAIINAGTSERDKKGKE